MHLVGYFYETYQDARSLEQKVKEEQLPTQEINCSMKLISSPVIRFSFSYASSLFQFGTSSQNSPFKSHTFQYNSPTAVVQIFPSYYRKVLHLLILISYLLFYLNENIRLL